MAENTAGAYTPGTELAGKVALITGAARNIGRATALALAAGGAAVAINTRASTADAQKVAQDIRVAGGKAEVYVADIANGGAVKSMTDAIFKRFGRIDILVLNASVRSEKPFLDLTYDEWRLPLGITLDGAFYCTQACLPSMIKNGGGAIITLGGMQSLSGAQAPRQQLGRETRSRGHDARARARIRRPKHTRELHRPGNHEYHARSRPRAAPRAHQYPARPLRRSGGNRERRALSRRPRRELSHRADDPDQRRPDDVLKHARFKSVSAADKRR